MATKSAVSTFLIFILVNLGTVFSQGLNSGMTPTKKELKQLRTFTSLTTVNKRTTSEPIHIAIKANIVRKTDGSGGLTELELVEAIDELNNAFSATGLSFFLFGPTSFINNDRFYNFSDDEELDLVRGSEQSNVINIYFVDEIVAFGKGKMCGYAYYPTSGTDRIILANECVKNGTALIHEMGHFFSLFDTHGMLNVSNDELVDGSNCDVAGDKMCDTPADPGLKGNVAAGTCEYTGTAKDANGDAYKPDTKNYMSDSRGNCRNHFSNEQTTRISEAYSVYKSHLYSKTYLAQFIASDTEMCPGSDVSFTNLSVNAVSYEWSFEGGVPSTSTEISPIVNYPNKGSFKVSLTITTAKGEQDIIQKAEYINVGTNFRTSENIKTGGFEEAELTEKVIDSGGSTFQRTAQVAHTGEGCLTMDFFEYYFKKDTDYIILGAMDASEQKTFYVSFDYAYAKYGKFGSEDQFALVYREPCGDIVPVWEVSMDEMQTRESVSERFMPEPADWKSKRIKMTIPDDVDIAFIALKTTKAPGQGNVLYIDNYEIIAAPYYFEIDEISTKGVTCEESGSLEIIASSDDNLKYSIDGENYSSSNIFNGLGIGQYNIYVKNSLGHSKSADVSIAGQGLPFDVTSIFQKDKTTLAVEVSSNEATFQWYYQGKAIVNSNTSEQRILGKGEYYVEVSSDDCTVKSASITIVEEEVTSLPEKMQNKLIKVFPNPASNVLYLDMSEEARNKTVSIQLLDLTGKVMRSFTPDRSIHIGDLPNGIYLLEVSGDTWQQRTRVVKN
ncbi:T9SS type A sorting domain-containing protein [Reichenbachiella versicolor]|uniref:T9SS type A sorting domain-containing protein n=1 Tax=Reichenbachiella versicolor TaxID=1821036 RepID=UPI000D6E5AD3|nr:T9SS type A sorting domain-containing protein [Reichenbachiella versicolor]